MEEKRMVSIEWHDLSLSQMVFVQAVIMPKIEELLQGYAEDLKELE